MVTVCSVSFGIPIPCQKKQGKQTVRGLERFRIYTFFLNGNWKIYFLKIVPFGKINLSVSELGKFQTEAQITIWKS